MSGRLGFENDISGYLALLLRPSTGGERIRETSSSVYGSQIRSGTGFTI